MTITMSSMGSLCKTKIMYNWLWSIFSRAPRKRLRNTAAKDTNLVNFNVFTIMWSSGQSSWLQIQRSRVRFQIFWKVVGLEWCPLSLVSTTEKLPGRNSSSSGLEDWGYGHGDRLRWPRDTLYPQKVATNFTNKWQSLGQYSSFVD
jgi:hypothetical protein